MKNRITVRNEHQLSARSRWFAKRSHAAGVLLSGWFFFWMVGIVQPCCIVFAGSHDDDHAMVQTMSTEMDAHLAGTTGSSSHPKEECPLVFTADTPVPSQAFSLPTTTDFTHQLVVASRIEPLLADADFSQPFDVYHPSPPPRTYLRTLRLRI